MGHYEDIFFEITESVNRLGLKEEFDAQLKKKFDAQLSKMNTQEKHKYKDTRARWAYALDKVKNNIKNGS